MRASTRDLSHRLKNALSLMATYPTLLRRLISMPTSAIWLPS